MKAQKPPHQGDVHPTAASLGPQLLVGLRWCVFEMFVAQNLLVPVKLANTLAAAGEVNSANALCTNKEDAAKIHQQIRSFHDSDSDASENEKQDAGYRMLDEAIWEVSNKAAHHRPLTLAGL